ncbi:MAG: hypothetical protein AAF957_07085 [Planctomycetota bacterium]
MQLSLRLPLVHDFAVPGRGAPAGIRPGHDGAVYGLHSERRAHGGADVVVTEVHDGAVAAEMRLSTDNHFDIAQPLPRGELLLVSARTSRGAGGQLEPNATVFDADGRPLRSFVLGDGIEDVQTCPDGAIWVSYFDEGVLGTGEFGEPVGRSGLVRWSPGGDLEYEFCPTPGEDMVIDCYALNAVHAREAWLSYYAPFSIVRVHDDHPVAVWPGSVGGITSLARAGRRAVCQDAYEDTGHFHLVDLSEGEPARVVGELRLESDDGAPLQRTWTVGRGSRLTIVDGTRCFAIDVRDVPDQAWR